MHNPTRLPAFIFLCLLFLSFWQELSAEWKRIYLASYPRSGNHWVRYLVEEATHVATSSVYCDVDPPHLGTPFPWGGFCVENGYEGECRYPTQNDSIMIKTHFPYFKATHYDLSKSAKAIRTIRHPIDSFYSNYLYAYQGNPPSPQIPKKLLTSYVKLWRKFQEYWNRQKNVLTVRYEDLYTYPEAILTQIMAATNYKVSPEDIRRAVLRYPPQGSLLKHLDRFSEDDLRYIREQLGDLMEMYGY